MGDPNILLIKVPDPSLEMIYHGVSQVMASFQRQCNRSYEQADMRSAILVSWDLARGFLDPEDVGRLLLAGEIRPRTARYIGHLMRVPMFATGKGLRETNGLIGWNSARHPSVRHALVSFYSVPDYLSVSPLDLQMGDYREPQTFNPGFVPGRQLPEYVDMESVKREMMV